MRAASRTRVDRYPPIEDYGLIGDCHSLALVSRCGSVDWCCMPRLDSPSCFGRLLDWDKGGHFLVAPADEQWESERAYLGDSLVLETRLCTATGEARLVDAFAMRSGGREAPRHQLLRVVEGAAGELDLRVELQPRFEYGAAKPWIRAHGDGFFTAIGGNSGLVITTDVPLAEPRPRRPLPAAGRRAPPHRRLLGPPQPPPSATSPSRCRSTRSTTTSPRRCAGGSAGSPRAPRRRRSKSRR